MATARSLQRKQEQLKDDQDVLEDRWTKILATEKYELDNPNQPAFEQAEQEDGQDIPDEQALDGYLEEDNYMPPSEDDISLGDDEFGVPEDPIEQERFKCRLMATARSLKKQQQLQADQDLLTD